ncbi:MAG: crosslink repair DNA glycosylase YcaQ family protein [bacterium]
MSVDISAQSARRFILGKHGLWPGRRWTGKDGTRSAMRAVEHLQLDPLVIVARSHDLMLHARVEAYRPEYFDQLTYQDREFFDWGGWLAVRPMDELPHWRVLMRRNAAFGRIKHSGDEHADAIAEMRARLLAGERIANRELKGGEKLSSWSYRGTKEGSLALYYLWRTGEAMTYERRGFERVYAATEAVAPPELLGDVDEHEAELFIARKEIAHQGIGRFKSMGILLGKSVSPIEHQALERELVERGELTEVTVEGWKGTQYIPSPDLPLLEAVARGEVPQSWTPTGPSSLEQVAILSPLDPVSARGRAKTLFGFDYIWEIYKKPEDVKYGRFTMPILWGDQLVGRADLKTDRTKNTLVVNGVWFEDDSLAKDDGVATALTAGVVALSRLVGAAKIDAETVTDRTLKARLKKAK